MAFWKLRRVRPGRNGIHSCRRIQKKKEWENKMWCIKLDISGAFDAVTIDLLYKALIYSKVQKYIILLIIRELGRRSITWEFNDVLIKGGKLSKGLAQGDPISPILFNIVVIFLMDPLIQQWQQNNYGVLFENQRLITTVYVDDVYLYAESGKDMHTMWNQLENRFKQHGVTLAS